MQIYIRVAFPNMHTVHTASPFTSFNKGNRRRLHTGYSALGEKHLENAWRIVFHVHVYDCITL